VVFDSPPLLAVTDAAVLAPKVDGTLLVLDSGVTRTDAARKAIETLGKVGVVPMGAVMNKFDRRVSGYYYSAYRTDYGAYYGSSDDDATGGGRSDFGPPWLTGLPQQWLTRLREGVLSLLG
jgi:Mrp family chromosome partitioning ATPase